MHLPFFFGATTPVDPTVGTVITLIGNLGSAGAAVAVVWFFLSYLKNESAQRDQRWEELAERYSAIIKDNSDAMREVSRSMATICKGAPTK